MKRKLSYNQIQTFASEVSCVQYENHNNSNMPICILYNWNGKFDKNLNIWIFCCCCCWTNDLFFFSFMIFLIASITYTHSIPMCVGIFFPNMFQFVPFRLVLFFFFLFFSFFGYIFAHFENGRKCDRLLYDLLCVYAWACTHQKFKWTYM